jgi:diguanylate cyclase (GGDEF)-like protein
MLISSKVALSISIAVAVVGATATAIAVNRQGSERRSEFQSKSLEAIELLALTVAPSVAEHRHHEVQGVLDNIANFPDRFHDVQQLEVIGEDGRVIASLDPTRFNEVALEASGDLRQRESLARFGPHGLFVAVPLQVTHWLGVVRASFDIKPLEQATLGQQRRAALLVVGTIVVLGVALYLVHRRLVASRLGRLADAAHALGKGSMDVRAEASGDDEIAALGSSFNDMAGALKRYTDDLEHIIAERTEELEAANRRLEALATVDPLTGLFNRRYFDEQSRRALEVASRSGRPLSLVLVDVDRFKSINDRFGHPAGDEVLKDIAALLLKSARKADLCARLGGEELAVLMPETTLEAAAEAAERMRHALERSTHATVPELREPVTASFGVATRSELRQRLEDLVTAADDALYRSKTGGRNRVTVAEHAPAEMEAEA